MYTYRREILTLAWAVCVLLSGSQKFSTVIGTWGAVWGDVLPCVERMTQLRFGRTEEMGAKSSKGWHIWRTLFNFGTITPTQNKFNRTGNSGWEVRKQISGKYEAKFAVNSVHGWVEVSVGIPRRVQSLAQWARTGSCLWSMRRRLQGWDVITHTSRALSPLTSKDFLLSPTPLW